MSVIELLHTKIAETGNARELQISSGGGARQNYEIAEEANDALKEIMRDVADFAVAETARRVGSTATRMLSHKELNKKITRLDLIVRKFYRTNTAKFAE